MDRTAHLRLTAAVGLLALAGTIVIAEDYDPTGHAGRYATSVNATVVRGSGGSFSPSIVYVPWLLNATDGLLNAAAVQAVSGSSGLEPLGAVSQSGSASTATRLTAVLGTVDIANPGPFGPAMVSNNVIIDEVVNRSNPIGTLLADRTLVFREAFSTTSPAQNNMGINTNLAVIPQIAFPEPLSAQFKLWNSALPGIDGTTGNVQTGTPGAVRDPNPPMGHNPANPLLVAVTLFSSSAIPDSIIGTGVWRQISGGADPKFPIESYLQSAVVGNLLPSGELNSAVRQTQPVLRNVVEPSARGGAGDTYIAFGVGISGVNITGGSALPRYIVVDRLDGDGFTDAVYIEADAIGAGQHGNPIGSADLVNTDPTKAFIDHQATGGGSGPFINSRFDMNKHGQVVALHETSGSPRVHQIRLYNPVWSGGRIVGYEAPIIVAQSGQDGILTDSQLPAGAGNLVPMSGCSVDDDGRVAFVAATDAVVDGEPPALLSTTNTLFVWTPAGFQGAPDEALHAIVKGGDNGDILTHTGGGPSLRIGVMPVDPTNTSDGFNREGLSDEGGFLAVNFRSGSGVLDPGGADTSVRGTLIIALGEFEPGSVGCDGDADGNGAVDSNDITFVVLRLGNMPGPCGDGDVDGNGIVDSNDLTYVVLRLGTCNPGGPCN